MRTERGRIRTGGEFRPQRWRISLEPSAGTYQVTLMAVRSRNFQATTFASMKIACACAAPLLCIISPHPVVLHRMS
jgi:hypothetical protein